MAPLKLPGFAAGSVVATMLPATREHAALLLTLAERGTLAFPVNPKFPADYLLKILKQVGCNVLVSDGDVAPQLKEAGIGRLHSSDLAAPTDLSLHLKCGGSHSAFLVLTSGSSGTPKAAALSLDNLVCAAERSNRNIPLGPGDGWLLSLPLFHVAGLGVLFRCITSGAEVVLPRSGDSLLASIQRPEVTHVSLVATQPYRLLNEAGGAEALRGLKAILCGGSAMPPALLEQAAREGLPLHTSYGMTETSAQITATRSGEGLEAWQSSGSPLAPDTVSISREGEIRVRGATLFQGYWQQGKLDLPLEAEGWFATGDLGTFDEAGRLHVTGRKGNRFVCGGENVQPEDIERALLTLPGVLRARVVALPDAEYVHVPVAFVDVTSPTVGITTVQDALGGVLPRHALPRRIYRWPHHLEREGEKLSRATLEAEAMHPTAR